MTKEPNMNGSVVINSKLEVNQNHRISERYVPKLCKRESKISKISLDKYINTYFPNQTELEIYRSRALFALKSRTAK